MPGEQRIRITLGRVYRKKRRKLFGTGVYCFNASVDGQAVGDDTTFNAKRRSYISLPKAEWSTVIDVEGKTDVRVRFQAKDLDPTVQGDVGTITHVLRAPWSQNTYRQSTERFLLSWTVELEVDGEFGKHPPTTLFACRSRTGHVQCTTVSGSAFGARFEIHPVRPTPTTGLPPRPGALALSPPPKLNTGNVELDTKDPINVIPNPPVIPILSKNAATKKTAARIEMTYIRPGNLPKDTLDRIEWRVVASGAADARILAPARGTKVFVRGVVEGEVTLEARLDDAVVATYRALVKPIKEIPCRVHLLSATGKVPSTRVSDVADHLALANRLLRQLGLALKLDDTTTVTLPTGVTNLGATGVDGVFQLTVPANQTDVLAASHPAPSAINYRANVLNIAYVYRSYYMANGRANEILGFATDRRCAAGPTTDSGSPSTSWINPTGIDPDAEETEQSMTHMTTGQRTGMADLYAMLITNTHGKGSKLSAQREYANTIVHELGHILGLRHRVGAGDDGLLYPPNENVMHGTNPGTLAQDFDIIQAKAVHGSPLVTA